ncbi:allophanate hydrolase subunit 1 [Echinicola sp. CAU 1574]|uniref:Allophanate hydrolase subunit 1 n=1 Tax=Echinicola arenosa TaxID=2774144 RepID=A0ABR9AP13_9BACT|nr:carboxyltransferase domain-containing protein [Echinicola arenosa]MBD8490523.1 allophanate hydrolase subunit 1 [Echinicola arenosa]
MSLKLNYKKISPNILEACWPPEIRQSTLMEMMIMKKRIISEWYEELWDVNLGYHCLSLHFKDHFPLNEVVSKLENFSSEKFQQEAIKRKRWFIPVLYEGKDLQRVSEITKIDISDIVKLHQDKPYLLHFYGFMPGFMYLGGLSPKLFAARKDRPDPVIEKGSVAIGGKQTGIYPMDSPGGWNIIGKTPLTLFNLNKQPPIQAQPGDEIQFHSIEKTEFESIQKEIANHQFELKYEYI